MEYNIISDFYKWVEFYKSKNINIGPINENLIGLFEDVKKVKFEEHTKRHILEKEL